MAINKTVKEIEQAAIGGIRFFDSKHQITCGPRQNVNCITAAWYQHGRRISALKAKEVLGLLWV